MQKPGTNQPSRRDQWVLLATILASGMAILDGTALNVALPALQRDLQADGLGLLWIVNAYLLMLAALILPGGSLGDHIGRRKVFMAGIGLFLVASLACGMAPDAGLLIAARVAQGVGGALMVPGSLAILTAYFPAEGRGKAIGTWSGAGAAMVVAGPLLGGALADAGLWRGVFFLNLLIGLLTLWLTYRHVPESYDEQAPPGLDYPGAALAALGLAGLTYGFTMLPRFGFGDPRIYGTLLGGVLALLLFVRVERTSRHPMLPLALFRSGTFSGANLLTLLLYSALSACTFFLALNLVQVQGYSPSQAGLAFMALPLPLVLLSRWAGKLTDRWGVRLPLITGPLVAGGGFWLLSRVGLTAGPAAYWSGFFPGILVFGFGMTITVVPLTSAVMGSVPAHYSGTASGVNNAVSRLAAVLAIAVLGAVAISRFTGEVRTVIAGMAFTSAQRTDILAEARNFGEARVPAAVTQTALADALQHTFRRAFADAFGGVMQICALLAWASAGAAALLIKK
jgi:EmrB/QacA subfamily drug resistance transporter